MEVKTIEVTVKDLVQEFGTALARSLRTQVPDMISEFESLIKKSEPRAPIATGEFLRGWAFSILFNETQGLKMKISNIAKHSGIIDSGVDTLNRTVSELYPWALIVVRKSPRRFMKLLHRSEIGRANKVEIMAKKLAVSTASKLAVEGIRGRLVGKRFEDKWLTFFNKAVGDAISELNT